MAHRQTTRARGESVTAWYAGRPALVIGGLGFMGINVTRALLAAGAKVTLVSRSLARACSVGDVGRGRLQPVEGDLRDARVMARAVEGHAAIFNFAGQSGAGRSMEDPWDDLDVNCRGNLVLLEAIRTCNPEAKVVFPGSRLQFGRPLKVPVDEEHPMEPLSIHAVHKLAAEKYFLLYHRVYGLRTSVLRITNPYGPGQPRDRVAYGIVNRFVHLALADQPLPIYGDGSQIRDYIFIDDVVSALLSAGASEVADGKVYNLGSGKGVRLVEMAQLIIDKAGGGRLEFVPWDPLAERIETGDFVADISRISRDLDWRPEVSLEEGVTRTVAACRET